MADPAIQAQIIRLLLQQQAQQQQAQALALTQSAPPPPPAQSSPLQPETARQARVPWKEDENNLLCEIYNATSGKLSNAEWAGIAEALGTGRTANAVKQHKHKLMTAGLIISKLKPRKVPAAASKKKKVKKQKAAATASAPASKKKKVKKEKAAATASAPASKKKKVRPPHPRHALRTPVSHAL